MTRSTEHAWLDRFAWLTAVCTLLLIGLGGLVTSKGAGMAVPDWPTTYGYNMFLFPVHLWTGGIFYEHTHRLFASFVGLLTTVLAIWLWVADSRKWLRWAGVIAFVAVVLQGVLGGLRVTLFKDELGIVHGALGQSFFVLLCLIAIFASGRAQRLIARARERGVSGTLASTALIATVLVFTQLILGASMRHQHAGLAVPDFPLAYGRVWPPTDPVSVERANQQRVGVQEFKPITAFHIWLHMAHRIGAVLTLAAVAGTAWLARREQGAASPLAKFALAWLGFILIQAGLGAATVWTNKAADVATAHVFMGAVSLSLGCILFAVVWRALVSRPMPEAARANLISGSSLIQSKATS
jgi:heme a synthase